MVVPLPVYFFVDCPCSSFDAGYSPGYRTVRGPHGMSYQYVYTGWDPGLYHQEYHAGAPHGHYFPTNTFCRCPNSGSESVRTKSGVSKCKKCSKPKTPYISQQRSGGNGTVSNNGGKVRARLQIPTQAKILKIRWKTKTFLGAFVALRFSLIFNFSVWFKGFPPSQVLNETKYCKFL